MIYLDNAATTQVDERVLKTMLPYFTEHFGNPESEHCAATEPKEAIRQATEKVEWLLNSQGKGKVIFTSGGTESNNMVFRLFGGMFSRDHPLCMNIITSETEHKSVLEPAKAAVDRGGSVLRMLKPGRKGYISVDDISPDEIPAFTLVSLMQVNNETGMINDTYQIGDRLRQFHDLDVFYHVDCVQSAGSEPIDVEDMSADLVSISSHKIHGPKGVGCLWVSDRLLNRMDHHNIAMILGGGQQDGFRAGTMDVPGIVGFGEAAAYAAHYVECCFSVGELSDSFLQSLKTYCDKLGIRFTARFVRDVCHHDPKILAITFPGADAETVVLMASHNGLCISNGAACNSVLSEPSYVLMNSGMSAETARNTVRVSFSRQNTYDDCDFGAKVLAETVKQVLTLNLTDAVR